MAASQSKETSRGSSLVILVVAIIIVGAIAVLLLGRVPRSDPFKMSSTAPDGYGALAMLLEQHGVRSRDISPTEMLEAFQQNPSTNIALVLPRHRFLYDRTFDEVIDYVNETPGALLITGDIGEPISEFDQVEDDFFMDEWSYYSDFNRDISPEQLIDAEPEPYGTNDCGIERLADLGEIDVYGAETFLPDPESAACYGQAGWYYISEFTAGRGHIISLASPYIFANARMQPQKEDGGQALSNASVALRLLGNYEEVWVIGKDDTVVAPTGEESLLDVIPDHTWLVFWLFMVSVVLLLWWKGRRLGNPVEEEQPVEIAGSALVSSIGDLRRRKGNAHQAATALRVELRRDLALRIGLPPNAAVSALVDAIEPLSTISRYELVQALCFDHESVLVDNQPVKGTYIVEQQDLVQLARRLRQIRTEVLNVPTT